MIKIYEHDHLLQFHISRHEVADIFVLEKQNS